MSVRVVFASGRWPLCGALLLGLLLGCGSSDDQDPVNRAPVARAGADQTVNVAATASLNGGASSDEDGDPLSYQWSFTSRPQGSSATLQTPQAVTASFAADLAGDYTVQLAVSDGKGGSGTDSLVIHANGPANQVPVARAGADQTLSVGSSVSLNGSASSDPDGDALSYQWSFSSRPQGSAASLQTPQAVGATFVPDLAGEYLVQLAVSDGRGGTHSDTVLVQANALADRLPSAYAGPAQTVSAGQSVSLSGSGNAGSRGGALTYTWSFRSRPQGSSAALNSAASQTPSFTADVAGLYQVDLVVQASGLSSVPDTATILAQPVGQGSTANPAAAAEILVSDQVLQTGVEGIGMNLTGLAGGTNFATNNVFRGSGFEPLVYRKLLRVNRAGTDATGPWVEWDSDSGPSFWDTLYTGFGNGAEMKCYRLVNEAGQPLAYAGGLTDAVGGHHVQFLGEALVPMPGGNLPQGGWISEGTGGTNRIYLSQNFNLRLGDYLFLKLKKFDSPVEHMHPRVRQYFNGNHTTLWTSDDSVIPSLVPHTGSLPASFSRPGESCLCLETTESSSKRAGQYIYHPFDQGEGQWYSQLHPGASYRVSVWLKQEGLGNGGQVRAIFTGPYQSLSQSTSWTVTGQWQQFHFDFTGPAYPASGSHSAPGIEWTGPGRLYLDNLALYRNDAAHDFRPYSPGELSLNTWLACSPASGKKPAVRFYPFTNGTSLVENLLGAGDHNPGYSVNDGRFDSGVIPLLPDCLEWAYGTGATPETRSVPFLTFTEKYTEEEWAAIIEYLGVPYDSAGDTPQSRPYAYLRSQQRGHGRPWTEDFREIVVEFGNETWHNGAGGYGWDGFSAPGAVHQGGMEYGIFASYIFKNHIMASTDWSTFNLGSKLKFALGANYDARLEWGGSYGEAAVQRFPEASYLGHANYVGPKWETGDSGSAVFDAHGLQETLMGAITNMAPLIRDASKVNRQLNGTQGTKYRLEAYEGGPSGYWTNQDNQEIDELYGKSLAMGVAALDAWLYSSQHGYVHQCYLGFASGGWWSSHTLPEAGGFRAHAGWLALQMRNRYALGDQMLGVTFSSLPTYNRSQSTTSPDIQPLIASYVLKDDNAYYVFVLSRKYPGTHDGVNFGTGYTSTNLHLPFAWTPSKITLHKLAHPDGSAAGPDENNRAEEKIAIVHQDIPLAAFSSQTLPINAQTGGTAQGLPPGTVYLYVFEK